MNRKIFPSVRGIPKQAHDFRSFFLFRQFRCLICHRTRHRLYSAYAAHTDREHSQSASPTEALHGRAPTVRQQLLPEARVYALSGGTRENARPDLFLKTAASGTLAHEARMDDTFHMLGIGPEVLEYLPGSES